MNSELNFKLGRKYLYREGCESMDRSKIEGVFRLNFAGLILLLGVFAACSAPVATIKKVELPKPGSFDPSTIKDIPVEALPILPVVSPNAKAIYQAGLAAGNNGSAFSKLGDCMTENPYFLGPFGNGQYELGKYADLKPMIEQFGHAAFARTSLAAAGGFNVAGPLDSTWADPKICSGGESPLDCEYRLNKPSLVVIMFGTNDVAYTDADTFNFYLRSIVAATIDKRILPLLSTFPTRPENIEKSRQLNQIVIKVAQDYDIPIMNLNRALEPLPNHGVNVKDTQHLSVPPDQRVDVFSDANLQYGFTLRNLVTLQAMNEVVKSMK